MVRLNAIYIKQVYSCDSSLCAYVEKCYWDSFLKGATVRWKLSNNGAFSDVNSEMSWAERNLPMCM